jgi:hypothetical protein
VAEHCSSLLSDPGKWGRAASLTDEQTAQHFVSVPAENNSTADITNSNVMTASNDDIIDLYSMEPEECMKAKEHPFVHYILLHSKNREITQVKALFNGGAMVGAMCASFFHRVKHCLGSWSPSYCQL